MSEPGFVGLEETYRSIDYDTLSLTMGQALFIEDEETPSDASVVGSTWQHVDSNGGPDRRFENNCKIPIANYGVIEFQATSGLHVLLSVSSLTATHQFGTLYPQSRVSDAHTAPHQQARKQQSPPRPKSQPTSAPPPAPLPKCYQVLGLTPACTQEEATAKYRQLAMSYHPDRVNHLAEEFKALAHQKMTEINNAYAELKRLRGW